MFAAVTAAAINVSRAGAGAANMLHQRVTCDVKVQKGGAGVWIIRSIYLTLTRLAARDLDAKDPYIVTIESVLGTVLALFRARHFTAECEWHLGQAATHQLQPS